MSQQQPKVEVVLPKIEFAKMNVVILRITPSSKLLRSVHTSAFGFRQVLSDYGLLETLLKPLESKRSQLNAIREKYCMPVRMFAEQQSADFWIHDDNLPALLAELELKISEFKKKLEETEKEARRTLPKLKELMAHHEREAERLRKASEKVKDKETKATLQRHADAEERLGIKLQGIEEVIQEGLTKHFTIAKFVRKATILSEAVINGMLEEATREKILTIIEQQTGEAKRTREEAEQELQSIHQRVTEQVREESKQIALAMKRELYARLREAVETLRENISDKTTVRKNSIESARERIKAIGQLTRGMKDSQFEKLMNTATKALDSIKENPKDADIEARKTINDLGNILDGEIKNLDFIGMKAGARFTL